MLPPLSLSLSLSLWVHHGMQRRIFSFAKGPKCPAPFSPIDFLPLGSLDVGLGLQARDESGSAALRGVRLNYSPGPRQFRLFRNPLSRSNSGSSSSSSSNFQVQFVTVPPVCARSYISLALCNREASERGVSRRRPTLAINNFPFRRIS